MVNVIFYVLIVAIPATLSLVALTNMTRAQEQPVRVRSDRRRR